MKIYLPERLLKASSKIEDWLNQPLIWRVRRIDPMIGAAFVFCVAYYWWSGGWKVAMTGALAFIFIAMCAQWLWRSS